MVSKLLVSTMLVAGIFGSSVASAADVTRNHTLVIDASGTQDYGDTFGAAFKGQTFDDLFSFDISGASDFSGSLISISGRTTDLNITGFNLIPASGPTITGGSLSGGGSLDAWAIQTLNVMPGSYKLEVLGTVVGSGGSFGGNVNVSPVPEPGALGMMVAGLGLMGVAMSRRKKRSDSFSA